jgi:hypothetical protein
MVGTQPGVWIQRVGHLSARFSLGTRTFETRPVSRAAAEVLALPGLAEALAEEIPESAPQAEGHGRAARVLRRPAACLGARQQIARATLFPAGCERRSGRAKGAAAGPDARPVAGAVDEKDERAPCRPHGRDGGTRAKWGPHPGG